MSFMQPQVYFDYAYVVETSHGTEVLPVDVVGNLGDVGATPRQTIERKLCDYLEPGAKVYSVELKGGFLARMSAPGYMDCTPWELHDTAAEAEASLRENYMDDADDGEEG